MALYSLLDFSDTERIDMFQSMVPFPSVDQTNEYFAYQEHSRGVPIPLTMKYSTTPMCDKMTRDKAVSSWFASRPFMLAPESEQGFVGECSQYVEYKIGIVLPRDVSSWVFVSPADYKVCIVHSTFNNMLCVRRHGVLLVGVHTESGTFRCFTGNSGRARCLVEVRE